MSERVPRLTLVLAVVTALLTGLGSTGQVDETWSGATPVTAGYWGPVIAAASGDTMLVDNVLIEGL